MSDTSSSPNLLKKDNDNNDPSADVGEEDNDDNDPSADVGEEDNEDNEVNIEAVVEKKGRSRDLTQLIASLRMVIQRIRP